MTKQIKIKKDRFKEETMPTLEELLESIVTAETVYFHLENKLFEESGK